MKRRILCVLLVLCIMIGCMPALEAARAETFTAYVVDSSMRVYKSPSTSADYTTVYYGSSYPCDAIQGDWARLQNGKYTGFCLISDITRQNPSTTAVTMYITTNGVKVYEHKSTGARVMMTLSQNDSYTATCVTMDGAWTRLINGPYVGFVESKYLSLTPVGAQTTQTLYVTNNLLNVYASASEASSVLGTIAYGESYVSDAAQGDWYRIAYGNGYGFCRTSGMSATDPNTLSNTVYITADNIPIYRKPDTNSGVMMYLSKNSSYTARAVTPDGMWYRLQNGQHFGYLQSQYVSNSPVDSGSYTVYIVANTLNAYAAASESSEVLGVMTYGESFICSAVSGEWARIHNDGKTAYCRVSGISAQNPNTINQDVYINADNVPVYRKAATNSGVMMYLQKNSCYRALARTTDGAWYRLQNGGYYGYVESKYILGAPSGDSQIGYIAANTLPAYASPSENSAVLGVMSYGESMRCLAFSGDWAQIQNASGAIGYCYSRYLTPENVNKYSQTVYVRQSGAMIYNKPHYSYPSNHVARVNEKYTGVAVTEDKAWVRVIYGDGYAYIESKYIANVPQQTETAETVYVKDNTMPVYASASAASDLLGVMSYGESLSMQAAQDGWARVVNSAGQTGYCRYGSITRVNPNTYSVSLYALNANTPVRKKPLADADILQSAARGAGFTAVAITDDQAWVRVQLGDGYGYISVDDLTFDKPSEDVSAIQPVNPFTVYVGVNLAGCYASSDVNSSLLGVMSYGESFTCIAYGNGWAKLRNGSGTEGYCQISALTTDNPNVAGMTVYPQVSGVTVYAKPTESASVLGTLQLNTKMTAVAITPDNEWLRLSNGSTFGYARAKNFARTPVDNGTSAKAAAVIALAQKQIGKKYVYAAKGPDKFDCSGLTYYVFRNAVSITLPRTAYAQGYNDSYPKISSVSDLQIGDLVFFDTSRDSDLCDHVGIYIGGGQFIHASSARGEVMTSSLMDGYYARTFSWGRRVL